MLATRHALDQMNIQLAEVTRALAQWPKLAEVFAQCMPNTLETTIHTDAAGTFVVTGDIDAMWLRDSSAQVQPYIRFTRDNPDLKALIANLIRRQAYYLQIDPYANAFNQTANGRGHQTDRTKMSPWVWERKFELDSLCYPVHLLHSYYQVTEDAAIFNADIYGMFMRIIETMRIEQQHDARSQYTFERLNCPPSDTLPFGGRGTPTAYTGMIWSGFRPSDDACQFGYLIPSNMFAAVTLKYMAHFVHDHYHDSELVQKAETLRNEITAGICAYGMVDHSHHGRIYAYETDGAGHYVLIDDANVPSLLSLPYLGCCLADDPIYRNTRAFVLSTDNPYYHTGTFAAGIGSPHTPSGYIWPIGLIMQGLTSSDRTEQHKLLEMLITTTAETNFMHESFNPNAPEQFTRAWFAWANSLLGEFIYRWATVNNDGIHGTPYADT